MVTLKAEFIRPDTLKLILSDRELKSARQSQMIFSLNFLLNTLPDAFLSAKKFCIEIMAGKGGYVCYISPWKLTNTGTHKRKTILTVTTADNLKKICAFLSQKGISSSNSVILGEHSRLHLIADLPADMTVPSEILCTAAFHNADELTLSKIYEHCKVVLPSNAINAILRLCPHS